MFVDFHILNELGSPSINSNTLANRPAAGQTGRLFVSTDTFEIYRDNGTTWDLIGGPGAGTVTGSGTATRVAFWTAAQTIGSNANLYWDNTNSRLGIGTTTPGVPLDIHGTGTIAQLNSTGTTNNGYLAFQRAGTTTFSIGDTYNAGDNYFRIFGNTLSADIVQIFAATGKTTFTSTQTISTGLARGNYFEYNMSTAAGATFSTPNAISAVGASLIWTLNGGATVPTGARSGLDAYNQINFAAASTLTVTQGTKIRAYSNLTAGWNFYGAGGGTISHLAGVRVLFPDQSGGALTVTNNYALLINDQTPNTGAITYTNRWGIYQEGASDTNYFNATTLIGTTVNAGFKLDVNGSINSRDIIYIGGGSNATYGIEIGYGRSTTGSSYVDLIGGDLTYTDYGARLVRETGGANANSGLFHRGTGLLKISAQEAGAITFETTSIERMRLDASGNLGLGVTPSAWTTNYKALQIGTAGISMLGGTSGINSFGQFGQNYYYDGINYRYLTTATANFINMSNGVISFFNAPSGTAGNVITFTQAMTLDASGNLLVGGTSVYAATITSYGSATRSGGLGIRNSAGTVAGGFYTYAAGSGGGSTDISVESAGFMQFVTASTERMRITAAGLVGIANSSPSYILDVIARASGEGEVRFWNNRANLSTVDAITLNLHVSNSAGQTGGKIVVAENTSDSWLTNMQFYINSSSSSYIPTEAMRITSAGLVGIGTSTPNASALVDISSTTKGLLPPRMTTAQKNAIGTPATGLVIYDTTLNKLCVYTGAAWETVTSV